MERSSHKARGPTRAGLRLMAACGAGLGLLGIGQAAFGQVPATLNGPPVQVRPYVPEPGLPEITINQGTLNPFPADTSGGAATSGDTGGGGGGGSGDSVATAFSQYLGQAVGSGQCVALVQFADPSVGATATWTQGGAVQGNTTLQPGTIIATFNSNGKYANATDGSSHAAIYLGQNAQGIQVEDQWVGQPAAVRTIYWADPNSSLAANNGSYFHVVSHAS